MDIAEAKLLKGLSNEERFEIATRALCQAAHLSVLTMSRLSDLLDRLEVVARRLETASWTKAINAELERRENERASAG